MPNTVYTVGNPIVAALKLAVTPDVSSIATLAVYRPDGTAIPSPTISAWGGTGNDEKTAQFYATDDGTESGTILLSEGDWVAVWKVTGLGATVTAKVYNVIPLPSAGTRPGWMPFLSEVADHVPWLTIDQTAVGAETYLGTFNGNTVPADEQAQRHIDKASRPLTALGDIPADLQPFGRGIIALRAAASLARAYLRRENALQIADALDKQADRDWKFFLDQLHQDGGDPGANLLPVWTFPEPAKYPGDYNL